STGGAGATSSVSALQPAHTRDNNAPTPTTPTVSFITLSLSTRLVPINAERRLTLTFYMYLNESEVTSPVPYLAERQAHRMSLVGFRTGAVERSPRYYRPSHSGCARPSLWRALANDAASGQACVPPRFGFDM